MYDIETTETFDGWLENLRDGVTQKVVVKRIRVMSMGNLGKTRTLVGGLFEAKIQYGQGFRLYFANRGTRIIVLLCGGDKSTQKRDIETAREMLREL
jgi:putative addiction module killer protein